jgi:hypothetical protein
MQTVAASEVTRIPTHITAIHRPSPVRSTPVPSHQPLFFIIPHELDAAYPAVAPAHQAAYDRKGDAMADDEVRIVPAGRTRWLE